MGIATHLGPWLLGTRRSTIGTSAALGQVVNIAPVTVAQTKTVTYSDVAASQAFVIPAGALITNIAFYSASGITGTSPTITVQIGGTAVTGAQALTSATAFAASIPFLASAAGTLLNVGTVDQYVTYTLGGTGLSAGSGTLLVEYVVRNSDGTYLPTVVTGP